MMDKIDQILKYIPAFTLFCYICGFITYNSFLLQYGIIDTNIINLRFIQAGLLYMIIAPFVLATPIMIKKSGFLVSIFSAVFVFVAYNSVIGTFDLNYAWKACLIVMALTSLSYWTIQVFRKDVKFKNFDLTDAPVMLGMLIIVSLIVFSIYYKEIKSNFGGGKSYNKILILKEKKDNIINSDSLFHTDTLCIVYENAEFIYFKKFNSIMSLRKDFVAGEILLK